MTSETITKQSRIVVLGNKLAPAAMALAEKADILVHATNAYLRGRELEQCMLEHRPHGVIVRLGEMSAEAMMRAPELKIIAKHGVGFDTIDVSAASARGIRVAIAAGANSVSVAEHAFALMLGVARRVAWLDARMRAGHWDKPHFLGTELNNKTLGIVGYGAIGRRLAEIGRGFGMNILRFDPIEIRPLCNQETAARSLDEVLGQADVICLSCPLTAATRNMIGAAQFAMMKSSAILINTARGGLVDIPALVEALQHNKIAGAGLDTFPVEPPQLGEELLGLTNLVISPHIGASTVEAGERVGMLAMSLVIDGIAGRAIDARYLVEQLTPPKVTASSS